jgi:hypothetical protein
MTKQVTLDKGGHRAALHEFWVTDSVQTNAYWRGFAVVVAGFFFAASTIPATSAASFFAS